MKITSTSNNHIKTLSKMNRHRISADRIYFLIEGPHLIEMALKSGIKIKEVFAVEKFLSGDLMKRVSHVAEAAFEVSDSVLKKISETASPQGIAATASLDITKLEAFSPSDRPFIIVADGIQDPGNLGSIIRTADAVGADAVITLPGTCDAFSQKVIRSTAGSIFNIPVIHAQHEELFAWTEHHGIALIVTASDAAISIYDADLVAPVALIFGNEGGGIGELLKRRAKISLKIPIFGKAESINVAAAAAICSYEALRQRCSCSSDVK